MALNSFAAAAAASLYVERKLSSNSPERVEFKREGYNFWKWREHKIHYIVQGKGTPVLLIHGFGASAYHWRYNIPELSKHFEVYSMDLLGFGLSEKALCNYDLPLWSRQVGDFIEQVVQKPAILVGNSIGGLAVLQAAAERPELITGLALINPAGRFQRRKKNRKQELEQQKQLQSSGALRFAAVMKFNEWARRRIIVFAFRQLKQRISIKYALSSVYKNRENVDDYLIDSILEPALDKNSEEVFYRMISGFLFSKTDISLDTLLESLSRPLLVLWGDSDPLASPAKTEKFRRLYPTSTVVSLQAGHCPHDEVPDQVNQQLVSWIKDLR